MLLKGIHLEGMGMSECVSCICPLPLIVLFHAEHGSERANLFRLGGSAMDKACVTCVTSLLVSSLNTSCLHALFARRRASKRVSYNEEAAAAAEAERAAKRAQKEERQQLRGELNAWEAHKQQKLKHNDLNRDLELAAKYRRYCELDSGVN